VSSGVARPLFSVAIPTYNRGATFLPAAIGAVLAQSCADFELIVSDNGSSDDTERYVRSLTDSRIRYVRRKRTLPAGEHFALMASEISGEWLVLHQDDDLLHRDFLARARHALQASPGSNLYAAPIWRQVRNHGYHARLMRPQRGHDDARVLSDGIEVFDGNYAAIQFFDPIRHFVHPTIAMRRAALQAIGGYDSGVDYQSDLVTQARLLFGSTLLYDPRPGGISHVHAANFMRGRPRSFRKRFFRTGYVKLIEAFEANAVDWRALLQAYLGALSTPEIIACLKEWTYYRTPYELQRIGFTALRRNWEGSRLGYTAKCLSKLGPRNLARYALSAMSERRRGR
jgi:glycosyltransferase involved in cell wall biosynthesis